MKAFPISDGLYKLENETSNESYFRKEQIKSLGGAWNGQYWSVAKEALEPLKAKVMRKVLVDKYCHVEDLEERKKWATPAQIESKRMRVSCLRCDSFDMIGTIIEVYE